MNTSLGNNRHTNFHGNLLSGSLDLITRLVRVIRIDQNWPDNESGLVLVNRRTPLPDNENIAITSQNPWCFKQIYVDENCTRF
jgi:hypothetical protein